MIKHEILTSSPVSSLTANVADIFGKGFIANLMRTLRLVIPLRSMRASPLRAIPCQLTRSPLAIAGSGLQSLNTLLYQ